jgi:hypothetical protein
MGLKDVDEWFSGGIPLHEWKTEKSETTAACLADAKAKRVKP